MHTVMKVFLQSSEVGILRNGPQPHPLVSPRQEAETEATSSVTNNITQVKEDHPSHLEKTFQASATKTFSHCFEHLAVGAELKEWMGRIVWTALLGKRICMQKRAT